MLTPSMELPLAAVLRAKPVTMLPLSPISRITVLGGEGADSVGVNAIFMGSSIVGGAGNDTFNASSSTAGSFFLDLAA